MYLKVELWKSPSQFITTLIQFDTLEQAEHYKNFLIDLNDFVWEDRHNVDLTKFKAQYTNYDWLELLFEVDNNVWLVIGNIYIQE